MATARSSFGSAGREEVDQIFDLVLLQNLAEGRHAVTAVYDLPPDPVRAAHQTDVTQVRSADSANTCYAVAPHTPGCFKQISAMIASCSV